MPPRAASTTRPPRRRGRRAQRDPTMTRTLEEVRVAEDVRQAQISRLKAAPAFKRWREGLRDREQSFVDTRVGPLGHSDGGSGDGAG